MLDPALWAALAAFALATSTISAVVGMAGGLLLLTAMLLVLDPLVAIPVHGVVQLASNVSRAHLQRRHVRWRIVGRFSWLLLPAGALGLWVARSVPPDALRVGIAGFVLVATWLPGTFRLGSWNRAGDPGRRFVAVGALVGFANVLVGATGPLLAPFMLALELPRQAMVGTFAACQTLGHLAKTGLFGIGGFPFLSFALPTAALCGAALAGSVVGTRWLERVDERHFRLAVRVVLTALALRLAWQGLRGG